MERMKLLQESQLEEEGVTQEEMATRFELEKTESLLVTPSGEEMQGCSWLRMGSQWVGGGEGASICPGRSRIRPPAAGLALFGIIPHRSQPLRWCLVDIADHSLQSNVLCFVEDPEFSYKDFTRRGEQAPPTFHAQVGACSPATARGAGVAGPACLDGGSSGVLALHRQRGCRG